MLRRLTVALALGAVGLSSAAGPDPKATAAPSKSDAAPAKAEPEKAPAPKPEAPAPAPADAVATNAEGDDCDAACQEAAAEKEKFGSVDAPVRSCVRGCVACGGRGLFCYGGTVDSSLPRLQLFHLPPARRPRPRHTSANEQVRYQMRIEPKIMLNGVGAADFFTDYGFWVS